MIISVNFRVRVVLKSLLQIPHKKSPINLYLVIIDPQQICWDPSTAQDLARSKNFVSQPFPGYLPDSRIFFLYKLSFSRDFQHTPAATSTNTAPLNFNRAFTINWIFPPITCAHHLATKHKWIFSFFPYQMEFYLLVTADYSWSIHNSLQSIWTIQWQKFLNTTVNSWEHNSEFPNTYRQLPPTHFIR